MEENTNNSGSKPFSFGAKSVEELLARDAEKNGTATQPEGTPPTEPQVTEPNTPPTPTPQAEPTKRSWIEDVNKDFGLQFKSPDEFKAVLEKAKKVDEYEPKIQGFQETENKYKKQLTELQSSLNPLKYFSSPENFIAEQLRMQRSDLNPRVLQEVIAGDNKVMSDIDVLVKDALLTTPNLKGGEQGVKETILSDFGIDPSTPESEWPITVQNKIMIKANQARKEWNELKGKVQLPKVTTPEEQEAEATRLRTEKETKLKPIKETFSKFDKFTEEIEPGKVFEFNVPDDYKEILPKMFDTYYLEVGVEPNEDTLKTMEELKKATLLLRHFKQIYKTIEGDVQTRERAERDKLLNNNTPPNTQTATEQESEQVKFSKEHGVRKMLGKK